MKIIITGSLGHISRPLVQSLLDKKHDVTVISSNQERVKEIGTLGAKALIGSLEDKDFVAGAFKGADVVYTMVPPNNYFNPELDLLSYYTTLGENYHYAIEVNAIKFVVNLSSIGAHMQEGNGILKGVYQVEQALNGLSKQVNITHIRPMAFYYNLYGFVDMIKQTGTIMANYGADDVLHWVSPLDIASAVEEEIMNAREGRHMRYVVSDTRTGNETAKVIGATIGVPELTWKIISGEEMLKGLVAVGMNEEIAAGLVEMYARMHDGTLEADFQKHKPLFGKVKLEEFAKEFAAAF